MQNNISKAFIMKEIKMFHTYMKKKDIIKTPAS